MRLELKYENGLVLIGAVHPTYGLIATGEGVKLDEAVRALVSKFAELQNDAVEALKACGVVRASPIVERERLS